MDTIPGSSPMENPPQRPLAGLDPADLLKQGAAEDTFIVGAAFSFQPPSLDELAAIFPQFEILELIGQGGMGAVYKVRQKELDRIVALKILPPAIGETPGFAERFAREAKALAKLNHPGIVTIHEFGSTSFHQPATHDHQLFYFLMEFVDGVNLAQLMKTGRISPREALAIVPQICDALQFAHDQGIVHRDIKPENILLDRLGRVKVADFGIAKVVASAKDEHGQECPRPLGGGDIPVPTLAGKILGTPQYMAPEQIDHPSDVDHRADIYALGVVFYQMLTGELPGKELQAPSKKVHIDVRLDEIVLRAMEKNPELRYQQASAMRTRVNDLESALGGIPQKEQQSTAYMSRFTPIMILVLGSGVLGLICHIIWLLLGHKDSFVPTIFVFCLFGIGLIALASRPGPKRFMISTAALCIVLATLGFIIYVHHGGVFYPASSLRAAYKAPVIGRIKFNFTHPESTGGTGQSFDVKKWGETQWTPNHGNTISLTGGRSVSVKSRVNATRPDAPVAMVTTSSDNSHWETRELKLDGMAPLRQLVFSNGLCVEIQWSAAVSSVGDSEPPDPVQQGVMRQASRFADEMHPVSPTDADRPETMRNAEVDTAKVANQYLDLITEVAALEGSGLGSSHPVRIVAEAKLANFKSQHPTLPDAECRRLAAERLLARYEGKSDLFEKGVGTKHLRAVGVQAQIDALVEISAPGSPRPRAKIPVMVSPPPASVPEN